MRRGARRVGVGALIMSEWVKFHRELNEGAKRGVRRAHRYVYMELSLKARPKAGVIELPLGMGDVAGVVDLLGGDAREVRDAVYALSTGEEPWFVFEGEKGARRLRVVAWGSWNDPPGTSTDRVRALRERRRTPNGAEDSCQPAEPLHPSLHISGANGDTDAPASGPLATDDGPRVKAPPARIAAANISDSGGLAATKRVARNKNETSGTQSWTFHETDRERPGNASRSEERREEGEGDPERAPPPEAGNPNPAAAILAELRRHPKLGEVASESFASEIWGVVFSTATRLDDALVSIGEAAFALPEGATQDAVRGKVGAFLKNSKRLGDQRRAKERVGSAKDTEPSAPLKPSSDHLARVKARLLGGDATKGESTP